MFKQKAKEEYAIVLDFLPNGYPFDTTPSHRKNSVVQAIGKEHFILLELTPKKDITISSHEEVYIGEGKRDKIHFINGRLAMDKLTETAKIELNHVIMELVDKNESKFVEFFNKAQPINTRTHQLELLPGMGKKHMWELIEARQEKEFANFEDIKNRVKLMPDPKKAIIKRILEEIEGKDRFKIFVG